MPDCYTCSQNAESDGLPIRERIGSDDHWRVAHAFNTDLPGWLVLVPRRHVTAVADLTDEEAASLGGWLVRLSRALVRATGSAKTYVAQFAEAEGFSHVHFHVVPRAPALPPEQRGPAIFTRLGRPAAESVPPPGTDRLALRLAALLGG